MLNCKLNKEKTRDSRLTKNNNPCNPCEKPLCTKC